jgi:hypothetical protein
MTEPEKIPSAVIVLRMARERKGRYVLASRKAGMKLFAWILAVLDANSEPIDKTK